MTKNTVLHELHLKHGGHMVPFAGWSMPLHYGSQLEEHLQVRQDAGLFDVSHMLAVDLAGKDAKAFLRHLLANDVAKLKNPGKALYTCMLNDAGGILDDLICYHLHDEHYRIVVNAATCDSDLEWLQQQQQNFDLTITPRRDLAIIAVQGPNARAYAAKVFSPQQMAAADALTPFSAVDSDGLFIARTGYTGEDGYEILVSQESAPSLMQNLLEVGVKPCGLGARDTLRLEAGLNLYGTDMDETTNPYESNLAWTVDLKDEARDFIGKQALLKAKAAAKPMVMRGIVFEGKGVMRHGQQVRVDAGVGVITSGSYAPSLKCSVALARIPHTDAAVGEVLLRKEWQEAKLITPPFIKKGERNF